jgi:[protein-PII] uridylyltransferase
VAAARAFREGKAALIARVPRARPTATAATTLLRGWRAMSTPRCSELWAMPACRRARAGGRGRLRPRRAVPATPTSTCWCCCRKRTEADVHRGRRGFITACWDIGLEIGSSVRTVTECVAEARATSRCRPRCWSRAWSAARAPVQRASAAHRRGAGPAAFLRAKTLEMQQRHVKYEGTPYALEPNCKESPGGLRDLQVVIWVARAAGLGRTWAELAAKGLITPFEVSQLQQARRHAEADPRPAARHGRPARGPPGVRPADRRGRELRLQGHARSSAASEVLMHRYYWAAKAVTQLNQILMLNIEERINGSRDAPMRPINARFLDRAGMLEVAHDDLYPRTRTPSSRPSWSSSRRRASRACRRARCARCTTRAT